MRDSAAALAKTASVLRQHASADHQNKADIGAGIARQWFDFEHVDVIADLSQSAVGLAVVEIARLRWELSVSWISSHDSSLLKKSNPCGGCHIKW